MATEGFVINEEVFENYGPWMLAGKRPCKKDKRNEQHVLGGYSNANN